VTSPAGTVQDAPGRCVRDGDRTGADPGALQLLLEGLHRGAVHGRLEVAAGAAADVVVPGVDVDGDDLASGEACERTGQGQRVAPAIACVDADDDLREHDVLLSG
jgi:hypothetical protein